MSASKEFMGTLFSKPSKTTLPASLLNADLDIKLNMTVVGIYFKKSVKSWNASVATNPDQVVISLEKCSDKGEVTFAFYNSKGFSSRGFGEIDGIDQIQDSEKAQYAIARILEKDDSDLQVSFQIPTSSVDELMKKVEELFNQQGPNNLRLGPKHVDGKPMFDEIQGLFIKAGNDPKQIPQAPSSFCSLM